MGLPIPETIQNAPELRIGLQLYLSAFMDLSSSRAVGMGIGAIPWVAVHDYCERLEIVGEQREDMMYHIDQLDGVYIKHRSEKTSG